MAWTEDRVVGQTDPLPKRVQTVSVSPDGRRVAYVVGTAIMDGEKSEWLSHIHVALADGSSAFALTDGDKSSTAPAWSPDGKWIAFLMTAPKSEEEEKADKEKRDARVVDDALKLTRLYVIPVDADGSGKQGRAAGRRRAGGLSEPGRHDDRCS